MSQAKTLTPQELEQVLEFVKTKRYPERDRAMVRIPAQRDRPFQQYDRSFQIERDRF